MEWVGGEFDGHVCDILCPEEWVDPTLQVIEMVGVVAAVNASCPLFTLGHERNAALYSNSDAANKAKGKPGQSRPKYSSKQILHAILAFVRSMSP